MTRSKAYRTNPRFEIAATPNDDSLVGKAKPQTSESDLEAGGRLIVAGEQIRYPQRMRIECAAQRNAEFPKTGPSQILNARQKPGANCGWAHVIALSNSSRVIARNRTRAPVRKSV